MTEKDVVETVWLGYGEKVLWKPKIFWDLSSANKWVREAPINFGKCFIRQYNISKQTHRSPMTNQYNPVDIEAIRERANAATKGPWETAHNDTYVGGSVIDGDWDWIIGDLQIDSGQDQEDYRGKRIKENCIFVAHARQDIPALCDEIESLRERVKELEGKEKDLMALCERLANGIDHMDNCMACGEEGNRNCVRGGQEAELAVQDYNKRIELSWDAGTNQRR
jgi:hypothetical protein